jgi:hypothetical protein
MTTNEILKELQAYGDEQTKKTLANHGAQEPFFGVKVQDLKNYLDDSAELRNTFFENSSLMVDKLKVDKGSFKDANNRLTEVFTSG